MWSMDVPHPLPEELATLIADRFRVMGDPLRIRLLDRLRAGEATVTELVDVVGSSQQNVSKHLGVLHQAGIVARAKDGNRVRYSIADPTVFDMCETVCGGLRRQVDALRDILPAPAAAAS